jgi:hypothetical protein
MSLLSKFKSALEAGTKAAVIKALRDEPTATFREMGKLSQKDPFLAAVFKRISVADVIGVQSSRRSTDDSTRVALEDPRDARGSAVDTRTSEGRDAYDKLLLQTVKNATGPIGAGAIIAAAGGTPLQARTSLARLIEQEKITWTGKARGTKYEAL